MKTYPAAPGCLFHSTTRVGRVAGKKLLLVVVSLLFFQGARADLYLTEPFDYVPGQLTNATPWSTNQTSGDASQQIVAGDLSYPPLTDPAPVNPARLQWGSNVKGCRQISTSPLGNPGVDSTVYVSFIFYKATTNGSGNAPIIGVDTVTNSTINQTASDGMVLYHQQTGGVGNYHLGIRIGGGAVAAVYPAGTQIYASGNTNTGVAGQTNFVVMKYHFIPGAANDAVALWVNPDPGSFGGGEPAATTNDVSEQNFGAADAAAGLQYIQIRGGSGASTAGTLQLDNIRVGSTWADVTPTCITAGIVTPPANQAVSPGQAATFSITASGALPTYQWQTNNGSGFNNVGGATGASYTTPAQVLGNNGLLFRCVVSVSCDGSSTNSPAATLTVQTCVAAGVTAPTPSNPVINAGDKVTFSVTGNGTTPTYQWQTNNGGGWFNISGATSSSYITPSETLANNGLQFRCVVNVACNSSSTNSPAATLNVVCNTAGVSNPQNQTIIAGQTATFSVTGSGSNPTYQWATNNGGGWFNVIGATNASYTTPPEPIDNYGLQFECTVSVACDSSTAASGAASLIVNCNAANVTADPNPVSLGAGQTATFSITASGSLPTYQWQTNNGGGWVNIGGATSASYTTPPALLANNGLQFQCVVTCACGPTMATSGTATLSVYPANAQFRTTTSGNLNDPNTWEASYDGGGTWNTPAAYPPTDVNSTNVLIQNGHTVVNTANARLDQVVVQAGGQITVNTGTTLTLTNGPGTALDISGTVDVTGTLSILTNTPVVVESGGILENEQGGTEAVVGTLTFKSGGMYQHNYTTGVGTIPTAAWNAGSTCEITGYTTDTTTLASLTGQTFYNFIWNCPDQTSLLPLGGNVPVAVLGDFTVVSTGTGEIRLSQNNSPVLNISGNLNVQGGTFTFAAGTGKPVLNVSNNVSITGGTLSNSAASTGATINFTKAGTQTFSSSGSIIGPINWAVKSGSTLIGSGVLSSNLALAAGGSLQLTTNSALSVANNFSSTGGTVVVDLGGNTLGKGSYLLMNYGGNSSGSSIVSIINGSVSGGTAAIDAGLPNQLRLAVIGGQPKVTGVAMSGTTLTINGTNGMTGVSYGILTTTNLALPLAQWSSSVSKAIFDGSGNFMANVLNATNQQQFFIIKSPSP